LYALWDPQPVKTDERISDVVARPQAVQCFLLSSRASCSMLTSQRQRLQKASPNA